MTLNGILQLVFYLVVLIALAQPLGAYMARVFENRSVGLDHVLGPIERLVYRLCGIHPTDEMGWKTYTVAMPAAADTKFWTVRPSIWVR